MKDYDFNNTEIVITGSDGETYTGSIGYYENDKSYCVYQYRFTLRADSLEEAYHNVPINNFLDILEDEFDPVNGSLIVMVKRYEDLKSEFKHST